MMNLLRQIVAVLALAVASSGSLPLVVHHLQCHHTDVGHTHSANGHDSQSDGSLVQNETVQDEISRAETDQGEAVAKSVPQRAACSCAHGCVSIERPFSVGDTAVPTALAAADEDCSVCFQLSQVTSIAEHVSTVTSAQLAEIAVRHTIDFDLSTVECNYPPRGPPAV